MPNPPIRILLVDDSRLALVLLQRMISTSPDLEVVGIATNGIQALEMLPELNPSIICTDYDMPGMTGLQLTQEVMARFPCPILVVSSAVGESDSDRVFSILEAGAVDVFPKPRGGLDAEPNAAEQFVKKIKIVSGVRVHGRRPKTQITSKEPKFVSPTFQKPVRLPQIIVIGASTGGPQALKTILSQLPENFPVPVICIQHISSGFLDGLVSWLGAHTRNCVTISVANETPRRGKIYFPQENTHLVIDHLGRIQPSFSAAVGGHRPSVTTSFCSVAEYYGDAAIGVLLTGMGSDGGAGMMALSNAGALTICQDEASCVIYGMPRDAVERGAARFVLSLNDIAKALINAVIPGIDAFEGTI